MVAVLHDGASNRSMLKIIDRQGLADVSWVFTSVLQGVITVALGSAACDACGLVKLP
jgi:hypothetical protein